MKVLFSADHIRLATISLAQQLNADYHGKHISFLGVLKGSFLFLADLIRHVQVDCSVDFIRLSSYGADTRSSGVVTERMPRSDPVVGRHVVVVEEIVDSGTTLARLLKDLDAEEPASLKVLTLVDKTGRRETEVPVHYRGFTVEEGFLVGYGLDWNERFRNLPDIHVLGPEDTEAATGSASPR